MAKIFKRQKFFMNTFTAIACIVFVYALGFMTQYRGLFGLKLKQNQGIADFYEITLQGFNRFIFIAALMGMLIVLFAYCLEINKKVPDKFALIIMCALLAVYAILSVFFMVRMSLIMTEYASLDYTFAALEGLNDTEMKKQTFYIGYVIYGVVVVQVVSYIACLYNSYKKFLSERKKEDVIE